MSWHKRALLLSAGWIAVVLVFGVVVYIAIVSHDKDHTQPGEPPFARNLPNAPVPQTPGQAGRPHNAPGTATLTTEEFADKIGYDLGSLTGFGLGMIWALSFWLGPGRRFFAKKIGGR